MKKILVIFCLFVLLASCEGQKYGEGIVYIQNTGTPIDSVMYKCIETGEIKYTDSLGKWKMEGPFGSCVPDCQDFTVEFSKSGYQTQVKRNPHKNIYLETE